MAYERLGFTPSPYQAKVFDFVRHGTGNGVISAVAGSGKTKTIVNAMKLVPKAKKCLFIAFNNSIVDELHEKLKSYPNCVARTLHSLGFLIIRRNLGDEISIDEFKYRTFVKQNVKELVGDDEIAETMSKPEVNRYVDNITALIDFSRFNCAQSTKEVDSIAKKYGVPIQMNECEATVRCLKWGREHTDTIDFTDMVWLPYELSLKPLGCQYDWIFADEVQDFSLLSVDLFKRCFKRGTRFIAVGDKNQMINLFAGSSEDAFDSLCEMPNTTVFSLPITYRCAKNIVKVAQRFSPETVARDDAPDGEVLDNFHIKDIRSGDMVIARSKTPLIKLYTRFLKMGVPCYIKGQEIGRELLNTVDAVPEEITELNKDLQHDGVFVRMYDAMFDMRNRLMAKYGLDLNDATLSSYVTNMYDTISSLDTLAIGCKTRADLVRRVTSLFDEDNNGVCLSTIHKAKGLESERVFVLCNSTLPSKLAKTDWERLQERNLQYVAYTRPRTVLGYVSEKEVSPSGSLLEPEGILSEARYIENMVCRALGKQPMKEMGDGEMSRFRMNRSQTVINDRTMKRNTAPLKTRKTAGTDLLAELVDCGE